MPIIGLGCMVWTFSQTSVVWAADKVQTIPAPCLTSEQTKNPRLDLQSCEYLFSAAGAKNNKDFTIDFKKEVDREIDCFYKGYVVDNTQKECKDGYPTSGTGPRQVVCNINEGEIDRNKAPYNDSCGSPDTLNSYWERNQVMGIRAQAMKYFTNQILNEEIRKKNNLSISDRCQAMAQDYLQYTKDAEGISSKVVGGAPSIPSQVSNGQIDFCSNDPSKMVVSFQSPDGTQNSIDLSRLVPKSAACYLSISRDNRILMFSGVAECELWTRVDELFYKFASNKSREINGIMNECATGAAREGRRVGESELSRSAGEAAGMAWFKNCYRPKIQEFFRKFIREEIPGNFSSQNESSPKSKQGSLPFGTSFVFAVGFLKPLRKKAAKKKSASWKKVGLFLTANLLILYFGTLATWGGCCGDADVPNISQIQSCLGNTYSYEQDDGKKVFYTDDPTGAKRYKKGDVLKYLEPDTSCCDSGDITKPQSDLWSNSEKCAKCQPIQCEAKPGNIEQTGQAGGRASSANQSASLLTTGSSAGITPGGDGNALSGQSEKATAADTPLKTSNANSSVKVAPTGLSSLPQAGQLKSGSGGMGGFSSAAQMGGDSAKTQAIQSNSPGSLSAPNSEAATGGAYGSAAGNPEGLIDSENALPGRNSAVGLKTSAPDSVEFGGGSKGEASGEVIRTDDPADYFTRVGLEDNLFKVIHKRYESTTSSWIKTGLF
jgi:hypothetical protein